MEDVTDLAAMGRGVYFLGKQFFGLVVLCYTVYSMSLHWMFLLVLNILNGCRSCCSIMPKRRIFQDRQRSVYLHSLNDIF